jgi:hypothetical protein
MQRNVLYMQRNVLYMQRNVLYMQRNVLYMQRNVLYMQRNVLTVPLIRIFTRTDDAESACPVATTLVPSQKKDGTVCPAASSDE